MSFLTYLVLPMIFYFGGFNKLGSDHNKTVGKVLKICRKANLKLSKDECHFRCTRIPLYGEFIS